VFPWKRLGRDCRGLSGIDYRFSVRSSVVKIHIGLSECIASLDQSVPT
jgi:hypothetical protein